jgi:hypothetical protein
MKNILAITTLAAVSFQAPAHMQSSAGSPPAPTAPSPAQQTAPPAADATSSGDDLNDLDAMTFGCPKAGLNAAAREAAKVPAQGTYQFSFFRIVNDSHHASYEVHFKSNYAGEPDLNYCVLVYCQQGWDPRTTKTSVTKMESTPARGKAAAHQASCGSMPPPAGRKGRS